MSTERLDAAANDAAASASARHAERSGSPEVTVRRPGPERRDTSEQHSQDWSFADPDAQSQERTGRGRHGYRGAGGDPVAWVTWLFVLSFLTQRISALPNLSIPMTVPLMVLWLFAGWRLGIVTIEPRRTFLWLLAAGASAFVVLPQVMFVNQLYISVNSWLFWIVIWLPACFMLVDRSRETFQRALRSITNIGVWLGVVAALPLLLQFVGVPYRDYLKDVVPAPFLVDGFNTAYPFFYDSPLTKSNGWLALEPSFMSFTLGLCIMAGLLSRARTWKVAVATIGMLCTVAGSGFAIVLVGLLVMVLTGQGYLLKKYLIPGAVLAAIAIPTQVGQVIISRLNEGSSTNSSTALRTFEPYVYLFPRWVDSFPRVIFGGGAGSSRELVEGSGVDGLLVPTVAKVFYDYGIIAGALLLFVVLTCYVRGPEPAIAYAVLASMLVLQPPAQPLMVPAFLLSTLWSPVPWGERPRIVRRSDPRGAHRRRSAIPSSQPPGSESVSGGRDDARTPSSSTRSVGE